MDKQYFGSANVLANTRFIGFKVLFLLLLVSFSTACEFINTGSSANIPKDNPGELSNLASEFADSPSDNSYRMIEAVKRVQYCQPNAACTQTDKDFITYTYVGGLLDSVVEESRTKISVGREVTSRRQYHHIDPDLSDSDPTLSRLDKVSVRLNGNFHTLHDYFYDDEDDGSFKAITNLSRPKLRREYICDINLVTVDAQGCGQSFVEDNLDTLEDDTIYQASEVINYIYNENGYLYRKEFDANNDNKIDHQKIYRYKNNILTRVDTDNFYNGQIDERYTYERSEDLGLRVFADNNYLTKTTRGTDKAVSYRTGYQNIYEATSGQTTFSYDFYLSSTDQIQVEQNGSILTETTDYTVTNSLVSPYGGTIDLITPASNGDEVALSAHDGVISKECYYNRTTADECTNNSNENTHWIFTWELNDCWAGGLDDIDPEARAIDYLCRQGG